MIQFVALRCCVDHVAVELDVFCGCVWGEMVCVRVCVREREREREKECLHVKSSTTSLFNPIRPVGVCGGGWCVCVCVCVFVCARERKCECVCVCARVCILRCCDNHVAIAINLSYLSSGGACVWG